MKFVPVPGTEVLFCIHETRYRDYEAYAKKTKESVDSGWKTRTQDGFEIETDAGNHPVTAVSWDGTMPGPSLNGSVRKRARLTDSRLIGNGVSLLASVAMKSGSQTPPLQPSSKCRTSSRGVTSGHRSRVRGTRAAKAAARRLHLTARGISTVTTTASRRLHR